jgi:hypothetical protein
MSLACEHLGHYDEALMWVRRGMSADPRDASLQRLELRIRVLRLRDSIFNAIWRLVGRGD